MSNHPAAVTKVEVKAGIPKIESTPLPRYARPTPTSTTPMLCSMLLSRMATDSSVVEDPQNKMAKPLAVGDPVNFDDPPAPDREGQNDAQLPIGSHDDSGNSINKRHLCEPGTRREGERVFSHGRRPAQRNWRTSRDGRAIGPHHDIRVEDRKQRLEITAARSGKKGLDHFSLAPAIGVRSRSPSAYSAARPAR